MRKSLFLTAVILSALLSVWDLVTTRTVQNALIVETQQNTGNYVVKVQFPSKGSDGLAVVESATNESQWTDLHFRPSVLQTKANTVQAAKQPVTVVLSGLKHSSNLTGINPTVPAWRLTLGGFLFLTAFWWWMCYIVPRWLGRLIKFGWQKGARAMTQNMPKVGLLAHLRLLVVTRGK